jgi:hypothetical protein
MLVRNLLRSDWDVEVDPPPHVLEDEVGLELVAPDDGWRNRPDMSSFTKPFRASILARARFIEDLVTGNPTATSTGDQVGLARLDPPYRAAA